MIPYQDAYYKALKRFPYDFRWVKNTEGDYDRVDVNEKMRKEYAEQLVKNEEDE